MTIPSVPVLAAGATQAEIGEALEEAGCCVIDRAVEPAVMDSIREELRPHAAEGAFGVGEFEGLKTRRTGAVVLRSETFRSIAMHPSIIAAGEHIFARTGLTRCGWVSPCSMRLRGWPGENCSSSSARLRLSRNGTTPLCDSSDIRWAATASVCSWTALTQWPQFTLNETTEGAG